jgi:hypothetical protein
LRNVLAQDTRVQPWMPRGEWIVDAHREGKRFVVRADEKLTAFLELESAISACRGNSFVAMQAIEW